MMEQAGRAQGERVAAGAEEGMVGREGWPGPRLLEEGRRRGISSLTLCGPEGDTCFLS